MKGGRTLFVILFINLVWIKYILCLMPIQLDFENICYHQFTQGCPLHGSPSWKCAQIHANCSGDKAYHCIHNTTSQPFRVIHICAPPFKCYKGYIPVYDTGKRALSCELCQNGFYQPYDRWSDETPECLPRHKCEEAGHKIECDMGPGLNNIQDVYCRCDTRNDYVLLNWEGRGTCVEWVHATCYFNPCPDGQERLLNYSCALQCDMGQKRDDRDRCVPIVTTNVTSTTVIVNTTFTETTRTTLLSPTAIDKSPQEKSSWDKIVIIVAVSVAIIIVVLFVCWKCKCLKKCKWPRKPTNRRQSKSDVRFEREAQTGLLQVAKFVINAETVQIGDGNVTNNLKKAAKKITNAGPTDKRSSAGNQDPKAHDEEKGYPDVNPSDSPGNFRSINDETDAVYNLSVIVEVAKSVGIIRYRGPQGTGFRVGQSYIMTALHVVRNIINSVVPPVSHREGRPYLNILEDPNVHIDFDHSLPNDTSQNGRSLNRFNFEPVICYENEILDTAVLKLKPGMLTFPCQITRFGHCLKNLPMYFVGHSEGKVKQSDKTKPREDVTLEKIRDYQAWSEQHQLGSRKEYRGYQGADNPSKVLFDCSLSKGASGSPGFIISFHDNQPYIVTMLLRGYPDWLYDEKVSHKEKTCIQNGYTFEQGVRLTEVYYDMKLRNPGLCKEIFYS